MTTLTKLYIRNTEYYNFATLFVNSFRELGKLYISICQDSCN